MLTNRCTCKMVGTPCKALQVTEAPGMGEYGPYGGVGSTPYPPSTWGDRLLGSRAARVVRVEPCTQTRPIMPDASDSPIDGELYTERFTRGNLRATVRRGGTPRYPVGSTRKLHPFTGSSKGAGAANGLPARMYLGKRLPIGDAEPANTEVTARAFDEVAA